MEECDHKRLSNWKDSKDITKFKKSIELRYCLDCDTIVFKRFMDNYCPECKKNNYCVCRNGKMDKIKNNLKLLTFKFGSVMKEQEIA